MGTTGRESERLREPEQTLFRSAGGKCWVGWVLGAGGQIGKNKETIQCSKHLLSTGWVLKSRVQGGHSESLRSDWLTGKVGEGRWRQGSGSSAAQRQGGAGEVGCLESREQL